MMFRAIAIAAALALPLAAHAQGAKPGDTYQILRTTETAERSANGTSTSSNRDAIVERVIAVRENGVELEYDLVAGTNSPANWQFPARVFKPQRGPIRLLNRAELAVRVDAWLKRGNMTRAACGRWIFTWKAFKIECDPQSAVAIIDGFDPGPAGLTEGAPYKDRNTRAPARLTRKRTGPDGAVFVAELAVDPDTVRKAKAENDVAVAEINGRTLSPEAARRAHAADRIAGTITLTFYTDATGQVRRQTRVVRMEIGNADGTTVARTITQTLDRQRVEPAKPKRNPGEILI